MARFCVITFMIFTRRVSCKEVGPVFQVWCTSSGTRTRNEYDTNIVFQTNYWCSWMCSQCLPSEEISFCRNQLRAEAVAEPNL